MFYDIYKALCEQRGVSLSRAAAEIGLSNATVTKWKKTGAAPGGDTLTKVAAYFGVSVDKLLGVETPPAQPRGSIWSQADAFDQAMARLTASMKPTTFMVQEAARSATSGALCSPVTPIALTSAAVLPVR